MGRFIARIVRVGESEWHDLPREWESEDEIVQAFRDLYGNVESSGYREYYVISADFYLYVVTA